MNEQALLLELTFCLREQKPLKSQEDSVNNIKSALGIGILCKSDRGPISIINGRVLSITCFVRIRQHSNWVNEATLAKNHI